jgi:rhodanese-related sulfurtransferase
MRRRIYIARQRFPRRIQIARITPEELKAKLEGGEDVMVADVRHRVEFESGPTITPGALHLMIEELEALPQEVPRDRDVVLYCTPGDA